MIKTIFKYLFPKIYSSLGKFLSRIFTINEKHFERIFKNNKNYNSLDLTTGLTEGRFKDVTYLMKCRPSNLIETSIYRNFNWDYNLLNIISSKLGEGRKIVLDIGANIGAISIPLAKKHQNIEFHCFEPNPLVYKDLIYNKSINKVTNLKTVESAVSNSSENEISFYSQTPSNNMGLSSTKLNADIEQYEKIRVKNISINKYAANIKDQIVVIKIDTQGNELSIIYSADEVIKRDRPIILFEFEEEYFHSSAESVENKKSILEFFHNLNYELFFLNDHRFFPLITFKDYFHGDIIAVPI